MSSSRKNKTDSLSPGTVVGHYVIQQRMGAGGGGAVYRAFDHRLQRAVAVKILDPSLLGEETTWALAISEARAAGSLTHPNICTVFDVAEEDENVCLAMELVEGRSLHAAIPGHGLPGEATARYGAQIASALAHAHDKGVCHGDVSARNVMLTLDDSVKVLDFGLARFLAKSHSPAEPSEGARRDLQQLGILLCQMATGQFPPQALDVLAGTAPPSAILESPPVAALPKGLQRVIARCLGINSAERYQRAQQTAADLEVEVQRARSRTATPRRAITGRRALLAAPVLLLAAFLASIPLWHSGFRAKGTSAGADRTVQQSPTQNQPATEPGTSAGPTQNQTPNPARDAAAKKPAASVPEASTSSAVRQHASRVEPPAAKENPGRKAAVAGVPGAEVWVNTKTKIYHCAASRFYGKTQQGKYMTQAEALAAGFHPSHDKPCQ